MKSNKFMLVIMSLVLFFLPLVNASIFSSGDITFSVDQKDYYFKTGEDAIIPLSIENTYGKQIDGTLTYTYTQKIQQAGMQMSSTNSQSTPLLVADKTSVQGLNFGTSKTPSTLDISLKFTYTEKETRIVTLEGIKIHFVTDKNQKQNTQNKQTSSSKKYSQRQQQKQQQQDPFSQMQQQLNNMMGQQQQQPQKAKQALQNSQLAQDSSALKKQMEHQIQEQQQMKQTFQKEIAKNQEFQKAHHELLNQGFNITNANINPSTNSSGTFEINYRNKKGEKANIRGLMQNDSMKELQTDTPESRQKMLDKLQENKQFKQYNKQLQDQTYSQQNAEFNSDLDKTTIKIPYVNDENKAATITAKIVNGTIEEVTLDEADNNISKKHNFWPFFITLLLASVGYYFYKRYQQKHKKRTISNTQPKKIKKPFDYKTESLKLLEQSKKHFKEKQYKDAYGSAGQALRLFLSYKNNLNKEITNDEIISFLEQHDKNKKQVQKKVKECFDLCSLVEFAKYEANKKDFDKIISQTEEILGFKKKIE